MSKPVSRVLSCTVIYLGPASPQASSRHYRLSTEQMLRQAVPIDVASDRVYIAVQSPALWWALTSPFHPYRKNRRYISVALALESPPAAVSSCPALWCPDFPHDLKRSCYRTAYSSILFYTFAVRVSSKIFGAQEIIIAYIMYILQSSPGRIPEALKKHMYTARKQLYLIPWFPLKSNHASWELPTCKIL